MQDHVWMSNTLIEYEPGFGLDYGMDDAEMKAVFHQAFLIRKGERVDPSTLPDRAQVVGSRKRDSLPQFFHLTFFTMNEKAAELLRRFDLGNGYLHPCEVVNKDGKTPMGTYYFLVTGNAKASILTDLSQRTKLDQFGRISLPAVPRDDEVAVSCAALEGPDIWHETNCMKPLMLSDRLVTALREAGLSRYFHLKRVRALNEAEIAEARAAEDKPATPSEPVQQDREGGFGSRLRGLFGGKPRT